jgi:outer membrane protein TolC
MITPLTKISMIALFSWMIGVSGGISQTALDTYIGQAMSNNLVLQQKNISLQRAQEALKIARSYYYPSISFKADYLSGEGGRYIALPLGDLMNPVYSTLNALTGSNAFPQIANQETNFLPNNYYDARVHAQMPLLNTDIMYNKRIQESQILLSELEIEVYKKELVKEIKVAYFRYLSAVQATRIYESSLGLAKEGLRYNQSLVTNGKAVRAYVLRSESEVRDLESRITEMKQTSDNARRYFNFLINADANAEINIQQPADSDLTPVKEKMLENPNVSGREEMAMMDESEKIYRNLVSMQNKYWTPQINGFVDLGSQAQDWEFSDKSRYYFVGVTMEIPLFAGGKNAAEKSQANLDLKNQQLANTYAKQQLQLAAEIAQNQLVIAYENYLSAQKQKQAASEYERLIDKAYREGVGTFIETIDARNQLTLAGIQENIRKYEVLIALAEYNRQITN